MSLQNIKFIQRDNQRFFNNLIPVTEYQKGRKIVRVIEQPIYSKSNFHPWGNDLLIEDRYLAKTVFVSGG